jgi:hypothetical protein
MAPADLIIASLDAPPIVSRSASACRGEALEAAHEQGMHAEPTTATPIGVILNWRPRTP